MGSEVLLLRHITPRSAKASIQAFFEPHRTRQIQADREGRFYGCYTRMIAELMLIANADVPMPSPHEIADSVRQRKRSRAAEGAPDEGNIAIHGG
jgi:hypothetical protein